MNLHNEIMNLPDNATMARLGTKDSVMLYKEGHRDARHAAAELANFYEAKQQEHDKETLSTILWRLRRLPRCYGNQPHIVGEVLRLSRLTGIDCADVLNERTQT